ncbi:hypothetical protein Tco_0397933 [Tanacetum coccineum]
MYDLLQSRPSEIHKFCDATLRRTLEGLKSYYNDIKYGYVQKELTNDEVQFLKLFEEEIEVRLNYRDQMRRWEIVVFKFGWERSEAKEGANMAIADANNEKEHVNYVEGASQRQSDGNIGQGVKPKSIGTTAPRWLIAMLENGPWFIRNNPLILKKWDPYVNLFKKMLGRLSYARAMMELRANIELKETIVVAMPKFVGEGFYMCTIPGSSMSGNLLSVRVARQATRGVMIGPKVSFKSTKQIYKPISNKNGTSTSGKKKQAEVSRQEVINSNPFDALNSVENDDELGMNRGISKSAGKGSVNLAHGSSSNTPIIDKIDKLELQMLDGKLIFVDDERNLLVPIGNVDSESEVEVVFDETTNLRASTSFKGESDSGYGESDDDGKTPEKVDYPVNLGSDDEVELVDNENASYLASKPIGLDMV